MKNILCDIGLATPQDKMVCIEASKNKGALSGEDDSDCGSGHYLVLILASYCDDDECTDRSPCPACLQMSNVGRVPAGSLEVVGDFGLFKKYGDG